MSHKETEKTKYNKIWDNPQYRVVSPAMRHLEGALEWMQPEPHSSFNDYGAGSGRASEELYTRGFKVQLVDIASNAYKGDLPFIEACLWDLPKSLKTSDYGLCCDVMEHIPPEHVDDVFMGIRDRTNKAVYFQIALFHDNTFTEAGDLHLSVFQHDIWREKILNIFLDAEFKMIKNKHLLAVAYT